MSESIQNEINNLRKELHYHNRKYYVEADPEISDQEFDLLMKKLIQLEEENPEFFDAGSPSQRVGGEAISTFNTVKHRSPMKSLGNTYSEEDLLDFDQRIKKRLGHEDYNYVAELKIDGVSISIVYEKGKLLRAVTRGDGIQGDDVTHNIKTIRTIPLELNRDISLEVRGEVFFPIDDFNKFNQSVIDSGEKGYVNPRNTAAGTLKLLDPKLVAKRPLDAFLYNLAEDSNSDFPLNHFERLTFLKELGFKTNPHASLCKNIEEVIQYVQGWAAKRENLEYETDGIVIKINSIKEQEKLGYTAKEPRWAISYKFPAKQGTSIIKDILLSVGRLGNVTPIAVLDPIFLAGTTVARASLHNFDEIERKDIRIGDTVFVEKSGEIIPQVVSVVESKRPKDSIKFRKPVNCPECASELIKDDKEVALRCVNITCPAQVKRKIQFFVSKDGLDIDGLGDSIVELFLKKGYIKDYGDIYSLNRDEIVVLEGFGEKSVEKLFSALEKSKEAPFEKLISALGIRHIGSKASRILAENFRSIEKLKKVSLGELEEIDEIGPVMAESVVEFFRNENNLIVLDKLEVAGLKFESDEPIEKPELTDNFFKDKKFVLTGNLEEFSRKEAEAKILDLGGSCSSSVTSKTNYVIAGEKAGSKLKKAADLGISILSEKEFIEKLNNI